MIIADKKVFSMTLTEKYIELKEEFKKVKKLMVFDFAQHLQTHYSITLYVENNRLLIRTDNSKYQNIQLINFFDNEFKEYHYHASLIFELSERISMADKHEYFELGSPYFLSFIDTF